MLFRSDLIDVILDKAKQKGTGKWTSQSAMDFGVSIPTIDSSVSMRIISSYKDLRIKGENIFGNKEIDDKSIKVDDIEKSLLFSFIVSFAQGLSQLKVASDEKSYNLNFEEICKIWRGGCIIRAKLLENFMKAFKRNNELSNLLFDDEISSIVKGSIDSARKVSVYCINNQIPAFSLLASISYFDSIKSSKVIVPGELTSPLTSSVIISFILGLRGSANILLLPNARGPHSIFPWNQPITFCSFIKSAIFSGSSSLDNFLYLFRVFFL